MRTLVETQMIEDPPRFISFVLVILVSRGVTRNKIRFFYQLPRRSIWLLHVLLHNVFCFEDLLKICIFLYQSQRHCLEKSDVSSLQKIRCVMQELSTLSWNITLSEKKFLMVPLLLWRCEVKKLLLISSRNHSLKLHMKLSGLNLA